MPTKRRVWASLRAGLSLAGAGLVAATMATAGLVSAQVAPRPRVIEHDGWRSFPSTAFIALDERGCLDRLDALGISHEAVPGADGVRSPVRLDGPVGELAIDVAVPDHARGLHPYEVFDCRLVVALAAWAPKVREAGFDRLRLLSAYRPAHDAKPGEHRKRHPGGLAFDVEAFHDEASATWISVERGWPAAIGTPPCRPMKTDELSALDLAKTTSAIRQSVCGAAAAHLFSSILTPNYDRAHRNHVHLELTPGATWYQLL